MHMFKHVTIIGVGLIGGSLARALRAKRQARTVIGVCRRQSSLRRALALRVIDRGTLDPRQAVAGADLVVLASSPASILPILRQIKPFLKDGCIVTDVASVKGALVCQAEKILGPRIPFIGGHPMAGSEKSGVGHSTTDLFSKSVVFLTRTAATDMRALGRIRRMWSSVGGTVRVLSPARHDRVVAEISHLPHVIASALAHTPSAGALPFAATGFKDTTRIALSDPALWDEIISMNRSASYRALRRFRLMLERYERAIRTNDRARFRRLFGRGRAIRETIGT